MMGSGRPRARLQSLRWRLLGTVCIAALLGLVISGVLSYGQAQHEAEELMDGHLTQSARLLLALVHDNEDYLAELAKRLATVSNEQAHPYEQSLEFQIGRADGSLLLRSAHAPDTPLSSEPGYRVIEHDGHPWRMLTLAASTAGHSDYHVQVGQSIALRDRTALEVAGQAVLPIALISPLLLLLLYFSVRRGLKPLDDLAADVASRSPENLGPLASVDAPLEAQPLLAALNRLLGRLRDTLSNERRFTADAAHELRTPLAAVRIQAQVAQLSKDANDRQHALTQILASSDRATRVLEQLLRLARLDPLAGLPSPEEIDLAALAQQVLADGEEYRERSATAEASEGCAIRLEADASPLSLLSPFSPLLLRGDAELLAIALRNLLDNALRHTPPGSTITVFARRQGNALALGVADDGPGVAPADLPRLVERFYRGRDAHGEGSGLGLAIVQRVAELHNACLQLENLDGGGFTAYLRWPLPPAVKVAVPGA